MKNTLFSCLLLLSLVALSACSDGSVSNSKAEEAGTGSTSTEISDNGELIEGSTEEATDTSNIVDAQTTPSGLSVTNPSNTGNFTTGYNWNVIRGLTSTDTVAIEVNGYRLQKYVAGSQYWNYIAATKMQTLAEGENEYVVKAFDADDNVIDQVTYNLNYQNGYALPNVGASLNLVLLLTFIFTLGLFIRRQKA